MTSARDIPEEKPPSAAAGAPSAPATPAPNPARRVIQVALIALMVVFIYHVIADRLTPYTAQAAVDTPFAQVAPQVSGQVIAVEVKDNARTRKGQVLFRIDPQPFEIALRTAEANLAVAIQGADVAELDVSYAQADLTKQRTELATNNKLGRIVIGLWQKQAVSETTAIRARSAMDTSSADVTRAEVQLDRARSALGDTGA